MCKYALSTVAVLEYSQCHRVLPFLETPLTQTLGKSFESSACRQPIKGPVGRLMCTYICDVLNPAPDKESSTCIISPTKNPVISFGICFPHSLYCTFFLFLSFPFPVSSSPFPFGVPFLFLQLCLVPFHLFLLFFFVVSFSLFAFTFQ